MRLSAKACLSLILCELLVLIPACRKRTPVGAPPPAQPEQISELQNELQKSYLELFEISPDLHYSKSQINAMRDYLLKGEQYCIDQFKGHAKEYRSQLDQIQKDLKQTGSTLAESERHAAHCKIQQLRVLESQASVLAENAIPVAYDNRLAKLDLIENWPSQLRKSSSRLPA